ncbi:MAG: glutamate 5-kinase [Acidobacteriota bacterium]|nr:glutamate 5-kinase [Blastocatellia bacterium]MDW8411281.1 glutamate 5-kinase [Acidobacteriota bacterium]
MMSDARAKLTAAQRIVVKVGTNVVMRDDGNVALGRLYSLIESLATLRKAGKEVMLVSSGAVGLGAQRISLKPKTLNLKQACAAIGQSRLMSIYEQGFEKLGIVTAQVLLTEDDFGNRRRYLNLRATLNKLIELGCIPIINENDTVSTSELEGKIFGDNDKLSALVMSKVDADLLVLLSDVDGLYDANPNKVTTAKLIKTVTEITPEIERYAEGTSQRGRGGMKTKLEAARIAVNCGGIAIIASGRTPGILDKIFSGEEVGTVFLPAKTLPSKKRWIAYAALVAGTLKINEGAVKALIENKASLLFAGVTAIEGDFERQDVVSICGPDGTEIARGIVNYSRAEAEKLIGLHSDKIATLVKNKNYDALITRDNIVLKEQAQPSSTSYAT